jgi:hypothetical protein
LVMSLITMHVVKAVPGGASLHGDFVIDSPVTGEAEILASLTDRDKGEIAYRFGFGSYPPLKMPSDIFFQLYGIAPPGIDYEHRPVDYTTEKGFHVWINRGND